MSHSAFIVPVDAIWKGVREWSASDTGAKRLGREGNGEMDKPVLIQRD